MHFSHDIDDPYVQDLRSEFISTLRTTPPAFLVLSTTIWPLVGYERLEAFPELAALLSENYEVEIENDCYRIYRHNEF